MATGSIIVDEFWIIQAIEIIRTILPLQKGYGFENRGRVGMISSGLQVHNKNIKGGRVLSPLAI